MDAILVLLATLIATDGSQVVMSSAAPQTTLLVTLTIDDPRVRHADSRHRMEDHRGIR